MPSKPRLSDRIVVNRDVIIKARLRHGYTQEDLAKLLEVPKQLVGRLEKDGDIRPGTIPKLCAALGIEMDDFLDLAPEPEAITAE